jgi:hypothetical protein
MDFLLSSVFKQRDFFCNSVQMFKIIAGVLLLPEVQLSVSSSSITGHECGIRVLSKGISVLLRLEREYFIT